MQEPLKIAILDLYNNVPNEGMRCIVKLIDEFQEREQIDIETTIFNVRTNNEIPDLSYDIYFSSGGPGSPLESTEDWEKPYFDFIDSIFEFNKYENSAKKYMFLICHSFQLVSRHFGIGKITKRKSMAFGIFPVNQIDKNIKEELFDGLPEPFYVVDSREYQLVSPNQKRIKELGINVLRMEKERPHVKLERAIMAIRFSDEVFGTQFHPEADGIGMAEYLSGEEKRKIVIKTHGLEKYNDMIDKLDDPDKILLTESIIIPKFLKKASAALSIS
ncbi:MAG: GMP synthase [Arcicella sp.]|nr:GMP synthase [Arcicella sp.]